MKVISSQRSGVSKSFFCVALCAVFFALCIPTQAQQPTKVPKIGYLSVGLLSANPARIEAFRQGLREIGYVEGKNISIE
jgi:putative ABC transport system substrate-binding protein